MSAKLISVVLPAFNEEANIQPFYEELKGVLEDEAEGGDFEIIFVNDGSTDRTLARIRELCERDSRVKARSLSRNFGHQAALTAGLRRAQGDVVISMDCDFQDPPSVIPQLLAKWRDGNRIVYARRRDRADRPFKKFTAKIYYGIISRLADVQIPQQVGDFRLMDRVALDALLSLGEHARYLRGMVAWLGFTHDFVDYARPLRTHGETHYSLRKMIKLAMDGLLSFSFLPLRIALWLGILAIVGSTVLFVAMLYAHLVRGWPFPMFKWLVVLLFGFVGTQFILLWIIGEYIGRIYGDVRSRPIFVIEEDFGDE